MCLLIYKSRHERLTKTTKDEGSRKCRNWQTSKTKDLVTSLSCGFKSHLPHVIKRNRFRPVPFFRAEGDSHPAAYAARVQGFTLDSKEPRQVFTHGSH